MTREQRILEILLTITNISGNTKLPFEEKLQQVLFKVVHSLQAKRGSIMLLKGRKALEVAPSTKPELVGVKQSLDEESPSGWVLKNKKPLYVDRNTEHGDFVAKTHGYEKYTQLDKKAGGRIYTTGLGLAFCEMAVRAHKGSIGVKNVSPTGSRFWFSLPLDIK